MSPSRSAALAILTLLIAATSSAQRPSSSSWREDVKKHTLFVLKTGETVEGRSLGERRGELRLSTPLGRRRVDTSDVVAKISPEKLVVEFERRLQELSETSPIDAYERLARWCKSRGLYSGFALVADALLERDPGNEALWKLTKRLAPSFEYTKNHHEKGSGRWARAEVDALYAAAKRVGFGRAAMICTQLEALDGSLQLQSAVRHIKRGSTAQRWIAARMLGQQSAVRRVKPLYLRALSDARWQVRWEAVEALKRSSTGGSLIGPFAAALAKSSDTRVKVFAAEAIGQVGDRAGVGALMTALLGPGNPRPPRNHIIATTQEAYVRDFDVEIAQAAVIADPVVDVVQSGVVLDVAVVAITAQRQVYARNLRKLTGQGFGPDPKAWYGWWKQEQKQRKQH